MQMRRRKLFIIALSITLGLAIIILQTDSETYQYYGHWRPLDNNSCHYLHAGDALASGENIKFTESIFFHETSCKGALDARQACAVESAARAHPDRTVNVLFVAPANADTLRNNSRILDEYNNVHFYRIHVVKYAKGTPLEKFVAGGALNRTRWRLHHASDVLRYLTLYKWGGVYLDLDVVVARNLAALGRNWAATESETSVAAGAMAFSRDGLGRRVANAALRDIRSKYRGDRWGHNGPGVITRVLQALCATADPSSMSAASCQGFEVYKPRMFYPIPWQDGRAYFEPGAGGAGGAAGEGAFAYHVWNYHTRHLRVARGSLYEQLAKKFCPVTYRVYQNDFGY